MIIIVHQRVSGNKMELEDLKLKLIAITAIVQSYKKQGCSYVLEHQIEAFCEYVTCYGFWSCSAFTVDFQGHGCSIKWGQEVAR